MAVAFDAQSSASSTANAATSHNHTNLTVGSGSNRALVVMLAFSGTTGMATPTVTWDSGGGAQACTLITNASNSTDGNRNVFLFGLVAPISGNKTLAVSWSGSRDIYCAAFAVTGADQTGGATTFPNGTSAASLSLNPGTITVTSATGDYVAAVHATNNRAVVSVNNTQVWINNAATNISGGGNRAAGAATVTLTCTYDGAASEAVAGTSIKAAAAATASLSPFNPMAFVPFLVR